MRPTDPTLNSIDGGSLDVHAFSDIGRTFAHPQQKFDFTHLNFGQLRHWMSFTARRINAFTFAIGRRQRFQTESQRMSMVFAAGNPFKITQVVIGFITIFVIGLAFIGIRPDERKQNQAMNAKHAVSATSVEPYAGVFSGLSTLDRLQNNRVASMTKMVNRAHSATVANFVSAFVAEHRLPGFLQINVFHNTKASICQSICQESVSLLDGGFNG